MVDESLYLTTQEAALAVVATAMKKARLLIDTLAVNSLVGGILFSAGGMLAVMIESKCPETMSTNPGYVSLLQGLLYPIGLFYVVTLGADLFNSNILFFSVGLARGATSIVDLIISWFVSWWLNLGGTIFVCYIFCHYSGVTTQPLMVSGSIEILEAKASATFVETLIKAIAGNYFVCLAIYLQLMAKPLHVKFMLMALPIFTFVSMGFTHSVADMYMIVIGLINGANVSVATAAWKLFLPGALGNIIGGSSFGLIVPWYLHLYVVERDQRHLHLPRYELRDEQPELNQDSRVVRVRVPDDEDIEDDEAQPFYNSEKPGDFENSTLSSHSYPTPDDLAVRALSRVSTRSRIQKKKLEKSPVNVFPVYGMGPASERERSIAFGISDDINNGASTLDRSDSQTIAEPMGERLRRTLSRRTTRRDEESHPRQLSALSSRRSASSVTFPKQLRRFSFGRSNLASSQQDLADMNARYVKANITPKAANAANEAAGVSDYLGPALMSQAYLAVDPIDESALNSTNSSSLIVKQDAPNSQSA